MLEWRCARQRSQPPAQQQTTGLAQVSLNHTAHGAVGEAVDLTFFLKETFAARGFQRLEQLLLRTSSKRDEQRGRRLAPGDDDRFQDGPDTRGECVDPVADALPHGPWHVFAGTIVRVGT